MNKTTIFTYIVSIGAIVFAGVGFLTGWANSAECMATLMIGLNGLGIHLSNVALGNKLGRSY